MAQVFRRRRTFPGLRVACWWNFKGEAEVETVLAVASGVAEFAAECSEHGYVIWRRQEGIFCFILVEGKGVRKVNNGVQGYFLN